MNNRTVVIASGVTADHLSQQRFGQVQHAITAKQGVNPRTERFVQRHVQRYVGMAAVASGVGQRDADDLWPIGQALQVERRQWNAPFAIRANHHAGGQWPQRNSDGFANAASTGQCLAEQGFCQRQDIVPGQQIDRQQRCCGIGSNDVCCRRGVACGIAQGRIDGAATLRQVNQICRWHIDRPGASATDLRTVSFAVQRDRDNATRFRDRSGTGDCLGDGAFTGVQHVVTCEGIDGERRWNAVDQHGFTGSEYCW
ncbi:hypothetical protein D3C79_574200 [compost metagenome]